MCFQAIPLPQILHILCFFCLAASFSFTYLENLFLTTWNQLMAPYSSLPAHRLVSKCSTRNCRGFLFLGALPSGPASGTPTHQFTHSFCRLLAQHFNLTPGDLPNPGIKPGSPALQADALPSEPPGKPKKSQNSR